MNIIFSNLLMYMLSLDTVNRQSMYMYYMSRLLFANEWLRNDMLQVEQVTVVISFISCRKEH